MIAIIEAANQLVYDADDPYANMHPAAFPFVAATTYAFARLRPEDAVSWHRLPTRQDLAHLSKGIAMGSAAMLGVLGIAAARGWVSAPSWGWETATLQQVLRSTALLTAHQLATVSNEEIVFRGYGFDTLRHALGLPAAVVASTALFAVFHGFNARRVIAMSIAGILLLCLRFENNSLWLPFGFHLGWNLMQIVILGPVDGGISLRPLQLHGPPEWIGKPGQPEPGWLSMAMMLAISIVLGLKLWQRRARSSC